MAKSISEFIQEQEVGTVGAGSDNLVKAYAECAAALSLAQCYTEQATIMEFAAENDIDSLNIVQEADSEKKENIFKRAGGAIKNAWTKVVEFFKAIVRKISGHIADKRMENLKEAFDKLDDNTEIPYVSNRLTALGSFATKVSNTMDQIVEALKNDDTVKNVSAAKSDMTKFIKEKTDLINAGHKLQGTRKVSVIKTELGESWEKGYIQGVIKDLDKGVNDLEKAVKKAEEGEDVSDKAQLAKDLKDLMNVTIQAYDIALKMFNEGYNDAINSIKAAEKDKKKADKVTEESFYLV